MKQTSDGECEERSYNNGILDGEATVIFPDGSKEIRTYQVRFLFTCMVENPWLTIYFNMIEDTPRKNIKKLSKIVA